jgi:hypothetical protein
MSLEDDPARFIALNLREADAEIAIASDSDRGPTLVHTEETATIQFIDEDEESIIRPTPKSSTDSDHDSVEEVEQVFCFCSTMQFPFVMSMLKGLSKILFGKVWSKMLQLWRAWPYEPRLQSCQRTDAFSGPILSFP